MCCKAGANGKFATSSPLSVSSKSFITDLDALSLDTKPVQLLNNNEFLHIKPTKLQKSLCRQCHSMAINYPEFTYRSL